uniref:Conserved hypothetical plastid protein n=1 Tax=Caulacanthus okamurae TaxID=152008 RepID=A0A6H1U881_9FLOR|nr:conserved hypothetical plastid protein [Caulacanthus okamurae]QIZ74607.1 conserved hypothetical plastid protein [Caulacanthus okamurae]
MNKKIHIKKTVRLILISLEALDIHNLEIINIKCRYTKYLQNINNHENSRKKNYIQALNYDINTIESLSKEEHFQLIVSKTLKDYCKNTKSYIMKKYIDRFCYLYHQEYYDYFSNTIEIMNLAISNLYIINQHKYKIDRITEHI